MFPESVAHNGVPRQADQKQNGQRCEKRDPKAAIFIGKRRHVVLVREQLTPTSPGCNLIAFVNKNGCFKLLQVHFSFFEDPM